MDTTEVVMDFKRIRKFLLFIIVIMSATGLVSCSEKNSGPDFNVLLITVDTLRPDHLGCYGYKTDCSPYMDKLAASGIRFSNAWSQTNSTLPSHLSILTSSYIQDHGVFTNDVYYSKDLPSMDRLLGEAGLTTCGIVSVLHLGRAIGVGKHFDYFYDLKTNPPKVPSFQGKSRKADETTDIAVKWLQKHGKKPFFYLQFLLLI
jgi:arylsulfatase A-like enzyme